MAKTNHWLAGASLPSWLQIFEHSETFRQHISTLELVASMYNSIQATILSVERPLVAQMLASVEAALKKGSEVGCAEGFGLDWEELWPGAVLL